MQMEPSLPSKQDLLRRRLKRGAVALSMLSVLWCSAMLLAVNALTSRMHRPFDEPLPEVAGMPGQSLRLKTSDGHELGAWYFPGEQGRLAVVLLHGNQGSRSGRIKELTFLREHGCPVLSVTMRTHGDSTGEFNDFGYSSRHDVIAAVKELRARCPQHRIGIWAGSLSAAATIFAAPEIGDDVDAWLLECPYQDLRTALQRRLALRLPVPISAVAEWNLLGAAEFMLPNWREISPLNAARSFPGSEPVLVIAGGRDTRATPDEARAIATEIGRSAKVVVIENADHMQTFAVDQSPYRTWLTESLDVTE